MDRQEFRVRRKTLGLTQAELGELLGVTARAVGKWEAGDAPISPAIDLATRYLVDHDQKNSVLCQLKGPDKAPRSRRERRS